MKNNAQNCKKMRKNYGKMHQNNEKKMQRNARIYKNIQKNAQKFRISWLRDATSRVKLK